MPPNNNQQYYQQPQAPLPSSGGFGGNSSTKWIITVVLLVVLLAGALGFGFWAFAERQDYKNNVDEKIATAVKVAEEETTEANNRKFAEELKSPLKTYTGPESYGSIKVTYPKTWSGYINNGSNSDAAIDMYFHPNVVPAASESSGEGQAPVALHVQVLNEPYDEVVESRKSSVESGELTAVPYALPKIPKQAGLKFTGMLDDEIKGTEVVLPLRDKTIVITTQTDTFLNDFNTYILPNFTFVP